MSDQQAHNYSVQVKWTGNLGQGTSSYGAYSRDHEISAAGKTVVSGSSDPTFRGDPARNNPEDLLVGSLSACHMLWYLHLCAEAKIIVLEYLDEASGIMVETPDGGGRFAEVVLRPLIVICDDGDTGLAVQLHEQEKQLCFLANSVNFPVRCEPSVREGHGAGPGPVCEF